VIRIVPVPGEGSRQREILLAEIGHLHERTFPGLSLPDLHDPMAWWWLAMDGIAPVGFAGVVDWIGPGEERAAYLHRAAVLPSHRGQGIQRRMIRARLSWARRAGIEEAWTYTSHVNAASANNLIREGFTLWLPGSWGGSTRHLLPSDGVAWLYWRRTV